MLSRLLPLLACAASAFAAIEVIKAPGIEGMGDPNNLAFDAQGDAYLAESFAGNRLFRLRDGKVSFVSGVR